TELTGGVADQLLLGCQREVHSDRGAGPDTPAPTNDRSASLDQGAELVERPVRVPDELQLRDREVVTLAGLVFDALDHVRVDPVHSLRRLDQRLPARALPRVVEQLHDAACLSDSVEVERDVRTA